METFHMHHYSFRFFEKIQDLAWRKTVNWKKEKTQQQPKNQSVFWLVSRLALWCALCATSMINQTSASAEVSQRNRHSTFPMFHGRLCWWIAHYAAIPPPSFFPFFLTPSAHTQPHSHWASGVLWVGGLVGGSWGCRAEREGIQCNMHGEITIATLGDLQMLVVQGIVAASYHSQFKLVNCNQT